MNDQVIEELEEFIKQQQQDNFIRIEAKIGTIIAKNEQTLFDLEHFQEFFVNAESKIEKKNYRFESAISFEDFTKAQQKIKSQDRWELLLDIILQEHYQGCLTFRMGFDEFGKIFCYERKKELKAKHLDVLDNFRQYRISLSRFENIDYKQTDICIEKIRDWMKLDQPISCVRFKKTKIFEQTEEAEKFVFQVQQIEKNKKTFLQEIVQEITNKNNSFKKNLENVFEMLKTNSHYYKPFYEAEISLKQPRIAQNRTKTAEQFINLIRQYHDDIRLVNPKPTMAGVRDAQINRNANQNNNNQKQFQQNRGGLQIRGGQQTRGKNIKTRGVNTNQREDRQQKDSYSQEQNNSDQILDDNLKNTGYHEKINNIQQNQNKTINKINKQRIQSFSKDQQDISDSDEEKYQSRNIDYYE